jgi:hypothetical protein
MARPYPSLWAVFDKHFRFLISDYGFELCEERSSDFSEIVLVKDSITVALMNDYKDECFLVLIRVNDRIEYQHNLVKYVEYFDRTQRFVSVRDVPAAEGQANLFRQYYPSIEKMLLNRESNPQWREFQRFCRIPDPD